ncbi:hypothetical protein Q8F55_006234 [Vanrija albida]|uniref:Uncharacterized protein n=1 Tax=Vanrija albida TaxID=181172 RepID=A0ABR3PWL4_9TREE
MSTRFVNQDLASAVRDVVQIRNGSNEPQYLAGQAPPRPERRTPSPNTAGAGAAPVQPRVPPKSENPFETDEVETFRPSEPKEIKSKSKSSSQKEKDRKGSRHADVIDTWDPTGLGSAMWHHAGPYDAAAPSRNLNTPAAKAPMYAFGTSAPKDGQSPAAAAPAPSPHSVPVPPPKDSAGERRGSARPISGRASGGLSGQYSTSVPSGSYFPEHQSVPENDGDDHPGRRRQTDKERALKAAWGIDTPEPYEDFGWSPREDAIDLSDPSPENGNPPRSPGFKNVFGAGPGRTPPVAEEVFSPTDEGFAANRDRGSFSRPGVKRTKSLMQKIKSMVRKPDESLPPVPAWGERSKSMSAASPTAGILRPSGYGSGAGYGLESTAVEEEENGGVEPGTVNFADPVFGDDWDPASGHPVSRRDGEGDEVLRG